MSGIAHLTKDNTTRAARIDAMDTDSVNSIIERISGVNPTKLAEGNSGKSSQGSTQNSQFGAPPSPIVQNFQQQQPQQAQGNEMQQMQQRMQMLERKVAHYEGSDVEDAAAKKIAIAKTAQTNRSGSGDSSGGTYAPNMNTKASAKKIMKKDVVDGEPDGPKAQPGGQQMAASRTNILGISMNEWNDLIGVTTPYANHSEQQVESTQLMAESQEEFVEGYFTEDELAEAWFDFIEHKGYDPDEFADFAEAAESYGDEVALLAIQDLEDEFQEQVESCIEVDEARLNQEEVEAFWDVWLEDRGLSAELFHHMIDEAVATEDQDEIDNLLAVEDLFYEQLDMLDEQSTFAVKKMLRGKSGQQLSPADLGMKKRTSAVPDVTAKTRTQGAKQKGQGVMVNRRGLRTAGQEEDALPDIHPRGGKGAVKRVSSALPMRNTAAGPQPSKGAPKKELSQKEKMAKLSKMTMRLGQEAMEATAAEFQKELGTGKSILTRKDNSAKRQTGGPQLPPHLLRKKDASPAPAKPAGIKSKLRAAFGRKQERIGFPSWRGISESDDINFECDCDDSGGPSIDWERLTKSYEKRSKGKR